MEEMLEGKVLAITGAAAGIGRATALSAASHGATGIVISDREETGLSQTGAAIEALGCPVLVQVASTTDTSMPDELVAMTVARFGRLDGAVNNAGVRGELSPIDECSDDNFDAVIDVNLRAVFRGMRAQLRQMYAQGQGSIVNIASVAGLTGGRAGTAYTASKHALVGLTRSIAFTHLDDGIRCNAICPGGITTDIGSRDVQRDDFGAERYRLTHSSTPRHGDPDEIAKVASFLASDLASFVNGVVMPVDGGWMAA